MNKVVKHLVQSRSFALVDLGFVCIAGVLWYLKANISWWPLLLCLLPWAIRLAIGQFPFQRTAFDLFLGVFLFTAAVGTWATYNREAGWAKFWIILGAIFLYYAIAGQPRDNLWLVVSIVVTLGTLISISFLLNTDWYSRPADLSLIDRIGLWWQSVRPSYIVEGDSRNIYGGILAMLIPYSLATGVHAWYGHRLYKLLFALIAGGIMVIGLFLTSSRGAWIALAASLGLWFIWALSQYTAVRIKKPRLRIFALCLLLIGGPFLWAIVSYPGGIVNLANSLPGIPNGSSRFELAGNSLRLIADFPYTGGGLGSFAGLYSQYIMVIPHFMFGYSHNYFIDVTLELGILAGLSVVSMLFGCIWILLPSLQIEQDPIHTRLLTESIFASIVVVGLHGFVDDPLFANRGTPLLFLFVGMASAAVQSRQSLEAAHNIVDYQFGLSRDLKVWRVRIAGICVIAILAIIMFLSTPMRSYWYSTLGAIRMARIDLVDFPSGKWNDGQNVTAFNQAKVLFEQATRLNPNNRTAQYRLGLIALLERDFPNAVSHLESAYWQDPVHRGVRKALGYSYVWSGNLEEAALILGEIPEARSEMRVYSGWWRNLGRDDLADLAAKMVAQLMITNSSTSSNY